MVVRVVLALPTPHNVHSPLRKQLGDDITVDVLASCSAVELTGPGIGVLASDIRDGITRFKSQYGSVEEVDLVLTGLPVACFIAYILLRNSHIKVNFLVYNTKKRAYVRVKEDEFYVRWCEA